MSTPVDKDIMIIKEIENVLSRNKLILIIRVGYKLFVEYKKKFFTVTLSWDIEYKKLRTTRVEVIIRGFLHFFML